jgi:hypothetical protein
MMRAAAKQIPIESLEVEIKASYDDGALLGTSDSHPGYSAVRYTVMIESNAPENDIIQLLDEADQHSPYLDVFSRAQTCIRKVNIAAAKSIE